MTKFWTRPNLKHLQTSNGTKIIISVFGRLENIVGKGEIACISNFSFSHNVLKRLFYQTSQKVSLCGNGLICQLLKLNVKHLYPKCHLLHPFLTIRCFHSGGKNAIGKHRGKRRKMLVNSIFLLLPQSFLSFEGQISLFDT